VVSVRTVDLGNVSGCPAFFLPIQAKENALPRAPQDKQRIERATRESQSILAVERQARERKTARLREQRLMAERAASGGSDGSATGAKSTQ